MNHSYRSDVTRRQAALGLTEDQAEGLAFHQQVVKAGERIGKATGE